MTLSSNTGDGLEPIDAEELDYIKTSSFAVKMNKESSELFFEAVKGELSAPQETEMKHRIASLNAVLKTTYGTGQIALRDHTRMLISHCIRLQEAQIKGYDKSIPLSAIKERIQHKNFDVPIKLVPLREFDRPLPDHVRKVIEEDGKLFDHLHVLATFPRDPQPSRSAEIQKKDPILFGTTMYNPNELIYITDWIDPFCTMTLGSLLQDMQVLMPGFDATKIEPLTEAEIKKIMAQAEESVDRLAKTRGSNWRSLKILTDLEDAPFSASLVWNCIKGLWRSAFNRKKKMASFSIPMPQ